MSVNDTEKPPARYTLRPTSTPLPHAAEDAAAPAGDSDAATSAPRATSTNDPAADPAVRAANEDDDLYDPYSDYHDGTLKALEFERDPWR